MDRKSVVEASCNDDDGGGGEEHAEVETILSPSNTCRQSFKLCGEAMMFEMDGKALPLPVTEATVKASMETGKSSKSKGIKAA